jgi:hypothetical protein
VFLSGVSTNIVSIGEWILNGTIESVNVTADGRVGLGVVNPTRALEVAGDLVVSGTVSGGNPTMFKNRIINGNFDIWQRGTSFTNQAPGTYTTDRFCNNWDGTGATRTISRQSFTPGQTDVPGNPLYFYRFAQTVAGSGGLYNNCLIQHIEGVQTFAGQPIVVSFWARAFVGTVFIMSAMRQVFGTSGSADVDFSPTSQQTYVLTSNWQRYTFQYFVPSINGKTIGTAGDYLALYNYVNVNLIETIDITGVQLEKGTVATPFEVRPFATELALCQRYYQKSYDVTVAPGSVTDVGTVGVMGLATVGALVPIVFPVPMRPGTTMTIYNPRTGGTSTARDNADSASIAASAIRTSPSTSTVSVGSGVTGTFYWFQYTASSEL